MQFTCKAKELKNSISLVEKAVSQKSSLPILENIYIEMKDKTLTLRANNLEIGIENDLVLDDSHQDGSILIKAKTLSGIVSKIDDSSINFKVDENQLLSIKGNQADFDILCSDAKDYPVFPKVDEGISLTVNSSELKEMIKHTIIAVSYDDTKQFLNGILVKNDGDKLYFVATDGYRLGLKSSFMKPIDSQFSTIIPYKAVNELNRILQSLEEEKDVDIVISETQVSFKVNSLLLITRLIQGQFPDYKQVIPKESANVFKINRAAFLAAAERASIVSAASNNVVRFTFDNEGVSILANAKGFGDFKETVLLERQEGTESVKIAFNVRLVLDVVKTLVNENLFISFNNELSPCKITIENDDSFTYIIMPIRTTEYHSE